MATDINVLGYETLMNVVNNYTSLDAKGEYIWAARVLDRKCPLVKILPMEASNQIMSNIATRTNYLPSPGTRRFNEGVLSTNSKNVPLNDPVAIFEDYSEVDYMEWQIQNNPTAWRQGKDQDKVEGLTQKFETQLWYGALTSDMGGINGLATRFNNLSSYPNGDTGWVPNVWNGGASTGSTCSIWIIEFGPRKVYGIYPKNLPGGLRIEDLGKSTKETPVALGAVTNTYKYEVLRTHFVWTLGLQVNDERCVQRVCNINPTILASNNFDENVLIQAKNYLPSSGEAPGTAIFVNRAMKTQIDIRAVTQKLNTYFTQDPGTGDVFGRAVTRFQGIPIFVSEMLTSAETVLS
jgi:hypothetical protein